MKHKPFSEGYSTSPHGIGCSHTIPGGSGGGLLAWAWAETKLNNDIVNNRSFISFPFMLNFTFDTAEPLTITGFDAELFGVKSSTVFTLAVRPSL